MKTKLHSNSKNYDTKSKKTKLTHWDSNIGSDIMNFSTNSMIKKVWIQKKFQIYKHNMAIISMKYKFLVIYGTCSI